MKFAPVFALAALAASGFAQAQSCDRACLENFVDLYTEALIAHKPAQLALAPRVKNTEDGVRLDPGDGFWRTAIGKGSYRLFNTDPETGQVVFQGNNNARVPIESCNRDDSAESRKPPDHRDREFRRERRRDGQGFGRSRQARRSVLPNPFPPRSVRLAPR